MADNALDPRLAATNLHTGTSFDYQGSILPLDIWLAVLNAPIPKNLTAKDQIAMLDEKLKICDKAAPYIHPRLQAVDARIQGDVTMTVVTGIPARAGLDPGLTIIPPEPAAAVASPVAKNRMQNLKRDVKERVAIQGRKRTDQEVAATSRALEDAIDEL
jgi:hypothetical protein